MPPTACILKQSLHLIGCSCCLADIFQVHFVGPGGTARPTRGSKSGQFSRNWATFELSMASFNFSKPHNYRSATQKQLFPQQDRVFYFITLYALVPPHVVHCNQCSMYWKNIETISLPFTLTAGVISSPLFLKVKLHGKYKKCALYCKNSAMPNWQNSHSCVGGTSSPPGQWNQLLIDIWKQAAWRCVHRIAVLKGSIVPL